MYLFQVQITLSECGHDVLKTSVDFGRPFGLFSLNKSGSSGIRLPETRRPVPPPWTMWSLLWMQKLPRASEIVCWRVSVWPWENRGWRPLRSFTKYQTQVPDSTQVTAAKTWGRLLSPAKRSVPKPWSLRMWQVLLLLKRSGASPTMCRWPPFWPGNRDLRLGPGIHSQGLSVCRPTG